MRGLCISLMALLPLGFAGTEPPRRAPTLIVSSSPHAAAFEVVDNNGHQLLARYHADEKLPRPFFHPLQVVSDGRALRITRAFPMEKGLPKETTDHVHHRGLWFCHGDVSAEGFAPPVKIPHVAGTDLWSEGIGRGRIVCTQLTPTAKDDPAAEFVTTNEWRAAEGTVLLREERRVRLETLPVGSLLIIDSTLTAADRAITFGDTKEGSFAVRVNDQLCEKRGGLLRNSMGHRTEKECWGQLADWCDYSGKVEEQPCGVTLFDHPDNPARACWHARGYGLLAANPFGREKSGFPAMKGRSDVVTLKPGESLRLRYGALFYSGELAPEQIQEQYTQFVRLARRAD